LLVAGSGKISPTKEQKWQNRTYVFNPNRVEVAIVARNGEEVEDENYYDYYDFIRAYEQGFPLIYTEDETLLLRPVKQAELQSA